MSDDGQNHKVGYRNPPQATRFQKGRSGNPKGRPRGRTSSLPHDAALGRKIMVRDGGVEREMTAAEAFLLHLTRTGLAGNSVANRSALEAIETARRSGVNTPETRIDRIVHVCVAPGNPNAALLRLAMAHKLDRYRDTARVLLEPWLVEATLARLGSRRLAPEQQQIIVRATRTPHKIKWPSWWKM